jgi:hypothetical protein
MRATALHGIPSRRRRSLTRRRPGVAPHPDLVQRQFAVKELDRLWVAGHLPRADGPGLVTSRRSWTAAAGTLSAGRTWPIICGPSSSSTRFTWRPRADGLLPARALGPGIAIRRSGVPRRLQDDGIAASMGRRRDRVRQRRGREPVRGRSTASWCTDTASRREPSPRRRSSNSSRSSTTDCGYTARSGSCRPWSSKGGYERRARRLRLPGRSVSTKAAQSHTTTHDELEARPWPGASCVGEPIGRVLHGCLTIATHRQNYRDDLAWPATFEAVA